MTKNHFDLTIVIVTYQSHFWLKKTLQTLKEFYLDHTPTRVEVVVVDNGSTDQTDIMLRTDFPWVKLLVSSVNLGYAAANNLALNRTRSDTLMLLNPDVEFTPTSNLDILLNYLIHHPQVAVVTPAIFLPSGQLDWACHRGEPTLWASFCYFSGLEKWWPWAEWTTGYHLKKQNLSQIHSLYACSGAGMVIRRAAIDQVGLLDEQFFMYAEDLDWCHRFQLAGWQIVFHPQVSLIHHKYKSGMGHQSAQIVGQTRTHFYDTMLQYFDKYYAAGHPGWVRNIIKFLLKIKKGEII